MKTNTILSFLCCLIVTAASFNPKALAFDNNACGDNTIIIHEVSNDLPGAPRSIVPFSAEYDDLLNSVVLSCVDDCGEVSVTLVSTAGDWYQTVFDTEDGSIIIPASGDSGHYTLTIVTSDGATYVGEFVL